MTQQKMTQLLKPSFWLLSMVVFTIASLVACTPSQLRTVAEANMYFSGRLSLSQSPDLRIPDSQAQSWSAHFELAGNPEEGTLFLYTPVGTTVAKVIWQPAFAVLESSEGTQYYQNLDELIGIHFAQNIPVVALFDWLKGKPAQREVVGWELDLSRFDRGIIRAERVSPAPRVSLRVVVDEHIESAPTS